MSRAQVLKVAWAHTAVGRWCSAAKQHTTRHVRGAHRMQGVKVTTRDVAAQRTSWEGGRPAWVTRESPIRM